MSAILCALLLAGGGPAVAGEGARWPGRWLGDDLDQGAVAVDPEAVAGAQDGAADARAQVRGALPLVSGVGGAGVPAAIGVAVGVAPALGLPVIGGLTCGALGCASVAWAWDIVDTAPPPGDWQQRSAAYQSAYTEAYEDALLRARRKWVYVGGVLTTLSIAGGYVGAAVLAERLGR
ncbi:MAG: hypothetical protein H6739_21420 [Alphaproteobacteria bacterium]|nr:hypothetical protein [Alphaproteobacteria bacterium]